MNFKRVVVIRNPVSTHAERAPKYITQIRAHFKDAEVTVLETVRGGIEANEKHLKPHTKLFGPETLLGVVAGDGTFNMVATILMNISSEARQTAMAPLWGGNANDLAHMLNGRAPRSLTRLLAEAQTVNVRPLECTLTLPSGEKETRLAICYASFGASAAAARRLGEVIRTDHPSHVVPGVRFVREMGSVWRTMQHSQRFTVTDEGGASRPLFEGAFFNGSRIAKVNGLPLRLAEEHFLGVTVEKRSMASLLLHIARVTRRYNAPKFQKAHAAFLVKEGVTAQFDGETVAIPADTNVEIALAQTPLRLLARH
ncbi:MAG TPA: diacylglycerol kinase family protein [Candidatus Saccharimonadales bacterium]